MTKKDKITILNLIAGIPTTVLNRATAQQIDVFIEKHNMQHLITEENLQLCEADKTFRSVFK